MRSSRQARRRASSSSAWEKLMEKLKASLGTRHKEAELAARGSEGAKKGGARHYVRDEEGSVIGAQSVSLASVRAHGQVHRIKTLGKTRAEKGNRGGGRRHTLSLCRCRSFGLLSRRRTRLESSGGAGAFRETGALTTRSSLLSSPFPRTQVILKNERELVGTLKGFDLYVNMVLEDVTE